MQKLTEKEYFEMDNGIVQNITDEFIRPHIKHYQSNFVYDMQQEGVEGFSWDYVENQYHSKEEILEDFGYNKEEMTEEDALDHFYYNVAGSYVGEYTPIYIHELRLGNAK